ncbi:hypothetical protein H2201_004432 [Coniosporium apollinis]|uniref:Yip1 domain-containing protein n=1 Tax=Coniosporium apollinis TaxID=61459 RepID=A0ABQ9NSH8_9PEZI|nr:hypothetical protein H2201_004432 [Coniosporium apollinis]
MSHAPNRSHASNSIIYHRVPYQEYPDGTGTMCGPEKGTADPSDASTSKTPDPLRSFLTNAATVVGCVSSVVSMGTILCSMRIGTGQAIKRILLYPKWIPFGIKPDVFLAVEIPLLILPSVGAIAETVLGLTLWVPCGGRETTVPEMLAMLGLIGVGLLTLVALSFFFRLLEELGGWIVG